MPPCPFCAIAAGEADADLVHEDPAFVAFLDTRPLFHGHVLVVPRLHVVTLDRLPVELGGPLVALVQRVQRGVEDATGAEGSLHIVNNVVSQSVPHLHYHVIPRRRGDGLRFWLGPRHPYGAGDAAAMAARIRAAMPPAR